jgi:hypothetical protein
MHAVISNFRSIAVTLGSRGGSLREGLLTVMGHGIVAGNISCQMMRFAESPIADVRFNLKSKLDLRISRDLRSK